MKVCNNGKMHREEKSMGETKAYTFKVKPQEDSNIYRLIQIDSGKTLDDLHSAILRAFDFTAEHLYMFSRNRKPYDKDGYYSPYDEEGRRADQETLSGLGWKLKETWLYLYDFGDDWMFDVTLVKMEDTEKKARTRQLEGKGVLEQYPAYEEEDGWDEEDDWEDAPEDFAEEAEDAPFEDNILRDFFLGEDWDEEDDLDIMSPVEVLPTNKTMEKLLKQKSKEELEALMGRMGIALPPVPKGKRKVPVYAAALAEELNKDMEPLLGLLTGESMEFLVRLTEGKKVTLADCLGMLGELDVYFACGLADLEDFDEGVIRLTPEAGKCAEICSQKDRRQQIEVIVKLESNMKRFLNMYGVMEAEKLLPLLNSYTGCSMEMEEFYDKVLVPNACWDNITVLKMEGDEIIYVSILEEEDAEWVLSQIAEFDEIKDYREFTTQERKALEQGGIISLIPSMKELMDYLLDVKEVEEEECMFLVSELLHEGMLGVDIENFIAECGDMLRDNDIRMTHRFREMVEAVLEECPSAVLKGYSMKEYGKMMEE